eukprot:m.236709 g.236709  ORF g.236709 m.236709 type:complete len:68 (+) comp19352_c0_seq2:965-1168(+)
MASLGYLWATDCSAVSWAYSFCRRTASIVVRYVRKCSLHCFNGNGQSTCTTLAYNFSRIATPPSAPL